MDDLISRQAAKDKIVFGIDDKAYFGDTDIDWKVIDFLNSLPSVTPKEKTGKWYIRETYPLECDSWECSECKEVVYEKTKFCPECGARMVSE